MVTSSSNDQSPDVNILETVQAVTTANLSDEAPFRGASFLELGGDSITAMKVSEELSDQIGIDVPLDLILGAVDVQDLAEQLESRLHETDGES